MFRLPLYTIVNHIFGYFTFALREPAIIGQNIYLLCILNMEYYFCHLIDFCHGLIFGYKVKKLSSLNNKIFKNDQLQIPRLRLTSPFSLLLSLISEASPSGWMQLFTTRRMANIIFTAREDETMDERATKATCGLFPG